MNILFVVQWYGEKDKDFFTGNFHYELAREIQKKHNVAIYFPFDYSISENNILYGYEGGILTFRSNLGLSKLSKIIHLYKDMKCILRKFNPNIVHAHVIDGAGTVSFVAKKFFGLPYILTEHAPIEMMNLSKKNRIKTKIILKKSSCNVAVSTDLQEKLNQIYPKSNFICIFNGVIDPYSVMHKEFEDVKDTNCINAIIVCGLYSKTIKGLQYLLPAVQEINKTSKKMHLHICGGGTYLDYFLGMANDLGLQESVTFYGMCDKPKLFAILNQMDFAISSSLFESAGVFVEEACMMGKPLVITKSGGANSLIPEEFSIQVDKGSTEALISALEKMIKQYNSYNSEQIKEYGFEKFEMNNICDLYNNVYESIINL